MSWGISNGTTVDEDYLLLLEHALGDGSPVQRQSYLVFQDGTNYKARNGTDGTIDYTGTDSATVIQAALDALTSGGTVFLKGDFGTLSTGLTVSNHYIAIVGEPTKYTLLKAVGDFNIITSAKNYLTFKNLYFWHNGAYNRYGLEVTSGSEILVDRCWFRGTGNTGKPNSYGLALASASHCWIKNNVFHDSVQGLGLNACTDIAVNRNYFTAHDDNDIEVTGASRDVRIDNNYFYNGLIDAIHAYNSSKIKARFNHIYSQGRHGIAVTYEGNAEIEGIDIIGNWIESCTEHGILLEGSASYKMKRFDVSHNHVYGNLKHGIHLIYSEEGTVSNNRCFNQSTSGYAGIDLLHSTDATIIGNRTKGNHYGIYEEGNSDYNLILGNNARGNTSTSITVVGGSTVNEHNIT